MKYNFKKFIVKKPVFITVFSNGVYLSKGFTDKYNTIHNRFEAYIDKENMAIKLTSGKK